MSRPLLRRSKGARGLFVGDHVEIDGCWYCILDDTREFCRRVGAPKEEAILRLRSMVSGEVRRVSCGEALAALAFEEVKP